MNIYLAGKIDRNDGAWRDPIVGSGYDPLVGASVPLWVRYVDNDEPDDGVGIRPWRAIPKGIFGAHNYVGPFRQELARDWPVKWEGIFHGATTEGQHGQMDDDLEAEVVQEARKAIARSDLVFAYINSPDAYGTVAEIGYAAALGKFVWTLVSVDAWFEWDDFWFVQGLGAGYSDRFFPKDGAPEIEVVRSALEEAVRGWYEWTPAVDASSVRSRSALREAADSFGQIARWTSDPRVRAEADRMFRYLIAKEREAAAL